MMRRYMKYAVMIMCAAMVCIVTACGDDDEYDKNVTNVHYVVKTSVDLQSLYTVTVSYSDLSGVEHTFQMKDMAQWEYRDKVSGDVPLSCKVVAVANELNNLDDRTYYFNYESSVHYYRQVGGAHSVDEGEKGWRVEKADMEKFISEHPTIVILDFAK